MKIESAAEAYALLADWPAASRTAAHDIAAKACRAAMDGEIDAETARATFVALPAATISSRRRRALRSRVGRLPIGRGVRRASMRRPERKTGRRPRGSMN
ncbi:MULTISPECIES: DUF982 domain-containing protein [unclassified Mesorhizobium]|uniref:DUF982 domain-containing protein n=1 Tax=unclassified Mesorhizobium TaxID=325217 RepID=UPI001FE09314|nr:MULTISPECIES: DUF982 domain-containing protein [unclassified Mesorhizobium]